MNDQRRIQPLLHQQRRWKARHRPLGLALLLALWLAAWPGGLLRAPMASADGGAPNLAYLSGTPAGVSIIDLAQRRVTGTVPVAGDPRGLVLSPDARWLYVAEMQKNQVAVVDTQAKQVVATLPTEAMPTAVALVPSLPTRLWVANAGEASVTVFEPETRKRLATIPVGLHPHGLAWAPQFSDIPETDGSSEVYIVNTDAESLTVVNTKSLQVVTTIALPAHPLGVVVPALGGTAYVSTTEGNIYGVTLGSHQLFGPLYQGQQVGAMDYDATTGAVYLPERAANVLTVLRPVSSGTKIPSTLPSEPLRQWSLETAPAAIAITSDGSLGLVAQPTTGSMALLDVPGRQLLATIPVGGHPQIVLAGPYPPVVKLQNTQGSGWLWYVGGGLLVLALPAIVVWMTHRQRRREQVCEAEAEAELRALEHQLALLESAPPPPPPRKPGQPLSPASTRKKRNRR